MTTVTQIAQKICDDRGDLFDGSYTMLDIQEAVELAGSEPAQYIQYRWDNASQEIADFWPYTPQEWEEMDLLPNMQTATIYGCPISRKKLQYFIKEGKQPAGSVVS